MEYRFEFACSYFGLADYRVFAQGAAADSGMVTFRHCVPDYERETYNGDPAEIDAAVGLMWWTDRRGPLNPEIVAAFNAWQAANFEEARARFGEEFTPERDRPMPLRPGIWTRGVGYHPTDYASDLTPAGEQTVIPGCERNASPRATQLDLFG